MLNELVSRYEPGLVTTEKSATSRGILRLSRIIAPKTGVLAERVYRYMRILDGMADESPIVQPARDLLLQERQSLKLNNTCDTDLQGLLLADVMSKLTDAQQRIIRNDLAVIISGMLIDLRIRETSIPPTAQELKTRHVLNLWPVMDAFAVGWYGRRIKPTIPGAKSVESYGKYDALCDLDEDLSRGLILISDDNIARFGIKLTPGTVLPRNELEQYYNSEKNLVAKELKQYAPAVFDAGLPAWMAAVSYLYFHKRALRLNKPIDINPESRFTLPVDAKIQHPLSA